MLFAVDSEPCIGVSIGMIVLDTLSGETFGNVGPSLPLRASRSGLQRLA